MFRALHRVRSATHSSIKNLNFLLMKFVYSCAQQMEISTMLLGWKAEADKPGERNQREYPWSIQNRCAIQQEYLRPAIIPSVTLLVMVNTVTSQCHRLSAIWSSNCYHRDRYLRIFRLNVDRWSWPAAHSHPFPVSAPNWIFTGQSIQQASGLISRSHKARVKRRRISLTHQEALRERNRSSADCRCNQNPWKLIM